MELISCCIKSDNGSSAFAMHDFIKEEIVKEAAVEPLLYPAVLIVLWTYEGKVFLCQIKRFLTVIGSQKRFNLNSVYSLLPRGDRKEALSEILLPSYYSHAAR